MEAAARLENGELVLRRRTEADTARRQRSDCTRRSSGCTAAPARPGR